MHIYKYIIIPMIILAMTPALARVDAIKPQGSGPRSGGNNQCYYIKDYGSKETGDIWVYLFCGKQYSKCDGHKDRGHDRGYLHYHGDGFTYRGESFWCCNETYGEAGYYVKAANWAQKTDYEKKSVGNGTCDVRIVTDVCGGTRRIDCDAPGECNPGYIMRNGQCAAECQDGYAYGSATSNTCIACETTNHQGIKSDSATDGHKVCIKCDPDTEFFDRGNKACVKKSGLNQIPAYVMKLCFGCMDNEMYEKCVNMARGKSQIDDAVLKNCNLTRAKIPGQQSQPQVNTTKYSIGGAI